MPISSEDIAQMDHDLTKGLKFEIDGSLAQPNSYKETSKLEIESPPDRLEKLHRRFSSLPGISVNLDNLSDDGDLVAGIFYREIDQTVLNQFLDDMKGGECVITFTSEDYEKIKALSEYYGDRVCMFTEPYIQAVRPENVTWTTVVYKDEDGNPIPIWGVKIILEEDIFRVLLEDCNETMQIWEILGHYYQERHN